VSDIEVYEAVDANATTEQVADLSDQSKSEPKLVDVVDKLSNLQKTAHSKTAVLRNLTKGLAHANTSNKVMAGQRKPLTEAMSGTIREPVGYR